MSTSIGFYLTATADLFCLPREVIEDRTFLCGILDSPSPRLIEVEGKKYYQLDLEPDLFLEFTRFLLGGDFFFDQDVATFFDFMGYTNSLNYPLDFWKVKLRDNWIRSNFYRLKLGDSTVTSPELLIDRGPYVGLVDLTNFYRNQLGLPRFNQNSFKVLEEVVDLKSKTIVLAGGALVNLLYGDGRLPADLDFFVTSTDPCVANRHVAHLVNNYQTVGVTNRSLCLHPLHPPHPGKITRTANAITIGTSKPQYQIIQRLYTCPSEVVHGFDLDASGVLWDGTTVWATQRTVYSLKHRINYFDFDRMSTTYLVRLAKYASRGFQVWLPHFNQDKVNWAELDTVVTQTVLNSCNDLDLAVELLPHNYTSWGDFQWLKLSPLMERILDQRNPIDLILVATYFRYFPHLGTQSDYAATEELTRFRATCITSNGPVDEDDYDSTLHLGYWELAAKGYITYTDGWNDVGSRQIPVAALFRPSKVSCEASGLPEAPEWKKLNPMEQLSGTFNPTTLDSLEKWYNTAYLYGEPKPLLD